MEILPRARLRNGDRGPALNVTADLGKSRINPAAPSEISALVPLGNLRRGLPARSAPLALPRWAATEHRFSTPDPQPEYRARHPQGFRPPSGAPRITPATTPPMKFCTLCRSNPAPAYQSVCSRCHDFCRRARPMAELTFVKVRARKAAYRALRAGTITRQPCEDCGAVAEMHHRDYAKPLEVRWLCSIHHRLEHGQLPEGSFVGDPAAPTGPETTLELT